MSTKLRIFSVLCAAVILTSSLFGCGKIQVSESQTSVSQEQTTASESKAVNPFEEKITFSTTFFGADDKYKQDAIYKAIAEKFNVDINFISLSWDNWAEKDRIWINSGDMPDVMFWDFNYKDYLNYAKQGMIKQIPDDYQSKYPNIAKAVTNTGIADFISKKLDNKLYAIPRAVLLQPVTTSNVDAFSFIYRKDWAEKVGMPMNDVVSFDQLISLANAFVEKDPGGNGKGKTIGFSGFTNIVSAFLQPYNSYYARFYKVDGKYEWGPKDESTLEGMKNLLKCYNEGLIDQNFFSNKTEDTMNKIYSGQAGIAFTNSSPNIVNEIKQKFKQANPGIDEEKALGLCVVTGPDGKVHGYVNNNYWTASIFNPKMEDSKLERILAVMDYVASDEGNYLVNMGFEGKDYTKNGNDVTISREKKEDGSLKSISELYPSTSYFTYMTVCGDGFSYINPSIPEATRSQVVNMLKAKETTGLNIAQIDYDLTFFTAPNYDKFEFKAPESIEKLITEVIIGSNESNLSEKWAQKLKSLDPKLQPVLDEINKEFVK